MDYELKSAKEKWERNQREKKERARLLLERERKAKEQVAVQQEALENAQRLRRLEAAEAFELAQRQEQEDLELGDGVKFSSILLATPIEGDGDKIILPPSAFETLSSQGALDKGPMFFEITPAAATSNSEFSTHCGVLMFTAPEGTVGLPPHICRCADIDFANPPTVRLRYVRLPKGSYSKLQPEGLDFADVPNHKAVLETKLRHHATLSENDLLTVEHGGVEYKLRVLQLKPSSSVSVLETDIEVDVVGTVADDSQHEQRPVLLTIGKRETGIVEQGKYRYFKFIIDRHLAEAASKGEVEVSVQLEVDGSADSGSDADIYVARHPILFPSRDQHELACHDTGIKLIRLPTTMLGELGGTFSVAVYGFRGVSRFLVIVEAKTGETGTSSAGQKLGSSNVGRGGVGGGGSGSGYEKCSNCWQMVPVGTVALHEAYCRRHNMVCEECHVILRKEDAGQHMHCEKCGEACRRDEIEKHVKVFHELLNCSCGATLEMRDMVKHKASKCPQRRIVCCYCGDMVEAEGDAVELKDMLRGLSEHESKCGCRTDRCSICKRSVMLKEMKFHIEAVHFAPSSKMKIDYDDDEVMMVEDEVWCMICGEKFKGEQLLSSHLDSVHFIPTAATTSSPPSTARAPAAATVEATAPAAAVEAIATAAATATGTSFRESLLVLCPICGMAVHSERDLSSHFDMVH